MKKYIGVSVVNAIPMTRLEYNTFREWELPANENGNDKGYLVENPNGFANTNQFEGHVSWSPAFLFEREFRLVDSMEFSEAWLAIKSDKPVRMAYWPKGEYVGMVRHGIYEGSDKTYGSMKPYPGLFGVDGFIRIWEPTLSEMMATNWVLYEKN